MTNSVGVTQPGRRAAPLEHITDTSTNPSLTNHTGFITDAWATMSSNKDVFKKSKKVKIERPPVSAVTLKKQAANVSTIKEKDRDAIVRFRNWEDREIGRIEQRNAK